jgi:hypothetical protein
MFFSNQPGLEALSTKNSVAPLFLPDLAKFNEILNYMLVLRMSSQKYQNPG